MSRHGGTHTQTPLPKPLLPKLNQMIVAVGWLRLLTVVQSLAIQGSRPAASFVRSRVTVCVCVWFYVCVCVVCGVYVCIYIHA